MPRVTSLFNHVLLEGRQDEGLTHVATVSLVTGQNIPAPILFMGQEKLEGCIPQLLQDSFKVLGAVIYAFILWRCDRLLRAGYCTRGMR